MNASNPLAGSPLGRATAYPEVYSPGVLHTVSRASTRIALALGGSLPFDGVDQWTAWELSWLDRRGKPVVAVARFDVPATSPAIVESKSVKLYLGSFAQTRFLDADDVARAIADDLSSHCGASVPVRVFGGTLIEGIGVRRWDGESIDGIDVDIAAYEPDEGLLALDPSAEYVDEALTSDLLKSNCPVTAQPDWGSVRIRYRGRRIDRAALLRYLVSLRRHSGFHEQCVERIWCDVKRVCGPERLSVHARYLRRGGIDINPFRSDAGDGPGEGWRLARQ